MGRASDASSAAPEGRPHRHAPHAPRLSAIRREGERVTPPELFFDLVFVLAITECTALMSHDPTWTGLAQGLLVLGVLWWAWTSYAWLTSVIDPEAGPVRLVFFAAMALLLAREHAGYDERRDRLRARNAMAEAEAELLGEEGD